MTFSIVASTGRASIGSVGTGGAPAAYGVAVASKFLGVGSVVPAAEPGIGAVATQSFAKWSYRADSLALLRAGVAATEVLTRVTAADALRETRQLGVVGARGAASYTGAECLDWAGGVSGGDDDDGWFAIQGNVLTGPEVIEAMRQGWVDGAGMPLPHRLVAALLAGDAAGGDRRGRQGAALYVVQPGAGYDGSGVVADLRVDDHPDASRELARLLDLNDLYFGAPERVRPLVGPLADEVRDRLARLGHTTTDLAGALSDWAGIENLEMRLTSEGIDARVLEHLRAATS